MVEIKYIYYREDEKGRRVKDHEAIGYAKVEEDGHFVTDMKYSGKIRKGSSKTEVRFSKNYPHRVVIDWGKKWDCGFIDE